MSLTIVSKRSHDGRDACLDESAQHLSVSLINISHETIVHTVLQGALMATYGIGVSTRQSQGIDTIGLQTCYEVLIDQSAINHRYHFQHICICDASAFYHLGLDAQSLSHLRGLASATMHEDFIAFNS